MNNRYETYWLIAVTNNSSNDYAIDATEPLFDGKKLSDSHNKFGTLGDMALAGGKTYMQVNCSYDITSFQNLSSKIAFMDVGGEKILAVSDTEINWFVDGQPLQ